MRILDHFMYSSFDGIVTQDTNQRLGDYCTHFFHERASLDQFTIWKLTGHRFESINRDIEMPAFIYRQLHIL